MQRTDGVPRVFDDGADDHDDGPPRWQHRLASVRARLIGLLVAILLPWLGLLLYTQADERKAAIAHVNDDALRLIQIATSNQAAQIEAARQVLTAFAQLPLLRGADPATCSGFLAQMLTAYPLYTNFGVADVDGNVWCSAVPLRTQVTVADRSYFRAALATRQFAIGDYLIGRITRQPAITYAYPIVNAKDEVESVVFAAQSLGWLTGALSTLEFPKSAELIVTDRLGTVLARMPQVDGAIGQPIPERAAFARLSEQKQGGVFEADDAAGALRLWAHEPLIAGHELHATIGVPKAVAFAEVDRRVRRNLIGLALVTIAALAAAWFGSRFFILRQIDALVVASGKLAGGDLGTRAVLYGGRGNELALLARSFNAMAASLDARERELRNAQERTRAAEIELAVSRAQMEIASEIQRTLLPENPLTLAGVRYAGRCIPAVAVGGDYFGYFPRGQDGADSFISDVSGHGVGAALLMAEARTTFMAERLIAPSAAPILEKLNDLLFDDLNRATLFMTACCSTFNAQTSELSYANAGHPPALLLRADASRCDFLQAGGMLLGITKGVTFEETKTVLREGDIVVFYTDGITERANESGEFFGVERLCDAVIAHRSNEPEALIASVLAAADDFAGQQPSDDDLTIVAMKVSARQA
jgi:serine phosphatase RsbU (regulator of sigma subunit)